MLTEHETSGTNVHQIPNVQNLLTRELEFSYVGTLATATGQHRRRLWQPGQIVGAYCDVGTAPTGASIIIDVLKNGTTVYTTTANRPSIAASANSSVLPVVTPDVVNTVTGDYLTVNIFQVGSTIAGSDLTVVVLWKLGG